MNFKPVPSKEYAIVWEIRPQEAYGGLFEFGMEQRIALRRTWRALRGAPLPSFFKLKQFRKVPVVVSLHPALARTFILPFRLARKKGEGPIQPDSFQAMLRDFLAKTTFEMRRLAGEALGVEELDAILLDARLTRVLADDLEVREDRPFEGRRIEGFLQVTMTTRAVFHDLHDLLHSGRELFFTERGPAALAFLGRHMPGPLKFLDLEPGGGWFFRFDPDEEEVIKKTQFRWSSDELPAELAAAWGISKKAADAAYAMFTREGFSGSVNKFAARIFGPIEDEFEKALVKVKSSGSVYVRSIQSLPFRLPARRGETELIPLPLDEMLGRSGIVWDQRSGGERSAEDALLFTSFLEYYYHRGDPRGHKMLTKHIHWISA